ncbi:threonine ammonia-lyase [Amycolatopsis jejuensis]|uniref:threonine ammonia-lyase n=1 Tax=Amycolatopsis jejuensis TaxID=330084 RepID=UPI000524D53F|nr:pyridoxal-phosphate dependent enzyme [Amycolatopsis jejuensis]
MEIARPSWDNIAAATEIIDPVFLGSPVVRSATLDEVLGCHLVAKVETLNPIRSFKGRGTSYFVRTGAYGTAAGLVTASAGNFGQGLAYAAADAGIGLTVYSATTANPGKIDSMRRFGATVVLEGDDFDAAKIAATAFVEKTGAYFVVDGNEPAIAEGAGTAALELLQDGPLDAVLVSLGNGALATGVGTWVKHAAPGAEVVAIGATGAPSMAISWRTHQTTETPSVNTIADGIAIRVPVPYALDTMHGTVDDVAEVDDGHLITAMRLIHQHFGLVVEPAGVAGVAAVLADPQRWAGRTVGTILCGANIDRVRAPEWLFEQGT